MRLGPPHGTGYTVDSGGLGYGCSSLLGQGHGRSWASFYIKHCLVTPLLTHKTLDIHLWSLLTLALTYLDRRP